MNKSINGDSLLWKVMIVSHEQQNYILICSSRFSILVQRVNFSRQRLKSNSNQTKLGNLIVNYIKRVITFSSWIFSHIYDEFCGNLRNHKHIYLFQNWNLDGKNVDFIKPKRKQKCKLWKIYEFSTSSLWKATTFDFFTTMVVILLVYMRLIL